MKAPGETAGGSLAAGHFSAAITYGSHYETDKRPQDVSPVTNCKADPILSIWEKSLSNLRSFADVIPVLPP